MEAAMKVAVGRLADELFEWARKRLGDGDEKAFWTRLETVCGAGTQGRTARVFAAIRTAWLFENRREWTCVTILPCFNWKSSNEAKLMWKAFTFGATFSAGLWSALRNDFLAVFDNLEHLDHEAVRVFHQLVGRIAVHEPTWLHDDEAQRIVTHAPHIGREQIAWVFWTSLDAVGEKAGSLWRDRIGHWLLTCWQLDDRRPPRSSPSQRSGCWTGSSIPTVHSTTATLSESLRGSQPHGRKAATIQVSVSCPSSRRIRPVPSRRLA